jgi:stage II sporulation protein R
MFLVLGITWSTNEVVASTSSIGFRVIAHSDKQTDQEMKLRVRDLVVKQVREFGNSTQMAFEEKIIQYMGNIQNYVDHFLHMESYPHKAIVSIENYHVNGQVEKTLVIRLGHAKGKNWWCLMYPTFCQPNEVHDKITNTDRKEKKKKQMKFWIVEKWEEIFRD